MKLNSMRVRELIAVQDLTIGKLAAKAGISAPALGQALQRGTCALRVGGRIAAALGVSVREIWIMEE